MCFDADSRPPIFPIAGGSLDGTRMNLASADGTQFGAFAARAAWTEVLSFIERNVRRRQRL